MQDYHRYNYTKMGRDETIREVTLEDAHYHLAHVACCSGVNAESKFGLTGGCGDRQACTASSSSSSSPLTTRPLMDNVGLRMLFGGAGDDLFPIMESMLNPVDGCLTASRPPPPATNVVAIDVVIVFAAYVG